jgi:hypothetical protein
MAAQVTVTFLPVAGAVQADVATGAAGIVWEWASPELDAARWTVQFAAPHASPEEARRLKTARIPTATRRALRHIRRLSSSLSVVPLLVKEDD